MPDANRTTSQWVAIDRVQPHPRNPNRMTDETREKLRANIDSNAGHYPPLIVRSLECSEEYATQHAAGGLQILDGEHRWLDQQERGEKEIEVRIWPGLSDERAIQALLTLNRLHGEDDKKKRNDLIRDLQKVEEDAEMLARVLPEDVETITRIVQEATRAAVTDAQDRARSLGHQQPITIFADPEQAEIIRRGLKHWLTANDPQDRIQSCREGAAASAVFEAYLQSQNAV